MRDFRKIIAWQKAHAFAVSVQKMIVAERRTIPSHARLQLSKAASSISANIAEGSGKPSDPEFARFLDIAYSSAKECQNHLLLANDAGWISAATFQQSHAQLDEACRVLFSYRRSIRARP